MQAIALEEAETRIRETVKDEYFKRTSASAIGKKVDQIIAEALKSVKIPDLRNAAVRSLRNFALRQYNELKRSFDSTLLITLAVIKLTDNRVPEPEKIQARRTLITRGYDGANLYGSPLQRFSEEYIKQNVRPAIDRLAKQFTLDPDDVSGRNSLRNRAEMEVRYNAHRENIEKLKAEGVRLVIVSVHADCSERCRGWQGRVYSLDGTSGITDDGRSYQPLENATDVYYTTKAGKVYKNGLLGFNCRHYLVPYRSGYRFPKPNPNEEAKQYAITVRQRALERDVREWRTKAIENKGIDPEAYREARKNAIEANERYIAYSRDHRRAYYPSRTKII